MSAPVVRLFPDAEAVSRAAAEVLEGPADPRRLPSQRVRPAPGLLAWYEDRQAAARLTLPPAAAPTGG